MSELTEKINAGGKDLKWLGILTIVMGVLAILAPLLTGISVVVMVGFFVIFGGIARMIWAFQAAGFGSGLLKFGIGLLTLLCGIAMVSDPLVASGILTVMIAIYLLVDGGFEIAASFNPPAGASRGWLMFGGIISILLGIMIWRQFPLSGAWALGLFLGIKLLFVGMMMAGIGGFAQKKTN